MIETLVQRESSAIPVEIRRAIITLWLSVSLSVIATVANWWLVGPKHPALQIFNIAFFMLLIWKVSEGRNWARITWLVVFMGGCCLVLLFALLSRVYRAEVFRSPFSVVVFVVQASIQFYATVLLCTSKGRAWFLRTAR